MDFKTNSIQKISYIMRFYRRIKRLSQNDMAELLSISHRNYQRLETGEVEPKLETLSQISKVLNIPVSSLLCSSDVKVLDLSELSTYEEFKKFHAVDKESSLFDHGLRFGQFLIEQDKLIKPESIAPFARTEGDKAYVCPILKKHVGLQEDVVNVDQYLAFGNCVERWEIVFRHNLKNPVIEDSFVFPNGFFVFEQYHYNHNPNPDNPTTECLIRDITDRQKIETWIRNSQNNKSLHSINNVSKKDMRIFVR